MWVMAGPWVQVEAVTAVLGAALGWEFVSRLVGWGTGDRSMKEQLSGIQSVY